MGALRDLTKVLRHRNFRLLWGALSLSVIGDRLVTVALALYVTDLTGSATDLGLVLGAGILPLVIFLTVGGAWADRLPRHRVMVVTDLVRFALHALLAILIFASSVEIWQLIVIEALFGTAEAFFRPAATSIVPETVPEEEIQEANALITLFNNLAEFAGPALATALVLGAGAGYAFALDAATFLLSAALLIRIRSRKRAEQRHEAEEDRPSIWRDIREGFAEVRSRVWIWGTLAAFSGAVFAGLAPEMVLGPNVAREQYGELSAYGVFISSLGAGTIVGSFLALRWRPARPMRLGMMLALLWPVSNLGFALGLGIPLMVPLAALGGAGIALFEVWWITALAERVPVDRLARVTSYDWLISLGLLPVGFVLAGPLGEAFGAVEVMTVGSVIALGSIALGLLPRETRSLRRVEYAPELPAEPQPGFPTP